MSLCSDGTIMAMLGMTRTIPLAERRDLVIEPLPEVDAVQPASVDIRLGRFIKHQVRTEFARSLAAPPVFGEWEDTVFTLYPGEFYLGSTMETVKLGPRTSVKLEGKSSWGRCGLEVHSTAGWIDPGFEGQITLEMKVVGVDPVTVKAGDYIAQLCVFYMDYAAVRPYGDPSRSSKYQGQNGPTAPR